MIVCNGIDTDKDRKTSFWDHRVLTIGLNIRHLCECYLVVSCMAYLSDINGSVSDYGLAFLTSPEDKSNPLLWGGAGTQGFQPPEQLRFVDGGTGKAVDDFKILSPCNGKAYVNILQSCRLTQSSLGHRSRRGRADPTLPSDATKLPGRSTRLL